MPTKLVKGLCEAKKTMAAAVSIKCPLQNIVPFILSFQAYKTESKICLDKAISTRLMEIILGPPCQW